MTEYPVDRHGNDIAFAQIFLVRYNLIDNARRPVVINLDNYHLIVSRSLGACYLRNLNKCLYSVRITLFVLFDTLRKLIFARRVLNVPAENYDRLCLQKRNIVELFGRICVALSDDYRQSVSQLVSVYVSDSFKESLIFTFFGYPLVFGFHCHGDTLVNLLFDVIRTGRHQNDNNFLFV